MYTIDNSQTNSVSSNFHVRKLDTLEGRWTAITVQTFDEN